MGGINDPYFSSGIYFYSIYTGNYQKVMKMLLVKKIHYSAARELKGGCTTTFFAYQPKRG